jgi:hypothetical protein
VLMPTCAVSLLQRLHSLLFEIAGGSDNGPCSLLQLVADLGSLHLSNCVAWLGSVGRTPKDAAEDPSLVLLDTTTLTMRGLSAKVDAAGHSGGNIIKEYDEGTKVRVPCHHMFVMV